MAVSSSLKLSLFLEKTGGGYQLYFLSPDGIYSFNEALLKYGYDETGFYGPWYTTWDTLWKHWMTVYLYINIHMEGQSFSSVTDGWVIYWGSDDETIPPGILPAHIQDNLNQKIQESREGWDSFAQEFFGPAAAYLDKLYFWIGADHCTVPELCKMYGYTEDGTLKYARQGMTLRYLSSEIMRLRELSYVPVERIWFGSRKPYGAVLLSNRVFTFIVPSKWHYMSGKNALKRARIVSPQEIYELKETV